MRNHTPDAFSPPAAAQSALATARRWATPASRAPIDPAELLAPWRPSTAPPPVSVEAAEAVLERVDWRPIAEPQAKAYAAALINAFVGEFRFWEPGDLNTIRKRYVAEIRRHPRGAVESAVNGPEAIERRLEKAPTVATLRRELDRETAALNHSRSQALLAIACHGAERAPQVRRKDGWARAMELRRGEEALRLLIEAETPTPKPETPKA